jgi:L-fuculose-phosphate aldolase
MSASIPTDDLARLANAQRMLAMDGHDDITLGHMSLRDAQGRGVWIKKALRGIDEVWDERDFVLVDWNGKPIENHGPCHSEWPIHVRIMMARPDVNVVGHTHARFSVLLSATDEELRALNHEGANLVGCVSRFNRTAGLINTVELGDDLALTLGDNPVALLRNHGIVFVGHSIEEATLNGMFLERACRMQVTMASTGWHWTAPSGVDHDRKMGETPEAALKYHRAFFDYFERRLRRSERRLAEDHA